MGDPLSEDAEVLFRQVHPSFIQNDQPSSQPFAPTPKDDNKLSVDRGELTTPAASYALHTGAGHASAAVYGVSVAEFRAEALLCISTRSKRLMGSRPMTPTPMPTIPITGSISKSSRPSA